MIRPEVLRRRLDQLSTYLDILKRMQGYTLSEFTGDPERYGSAERFLHLSIEAITDMAGHVIAEEELGRIDQYRDAPRIFAQQGWIDEKMEEKWIRMIGFRNVLVHDYLDVDRHLVYNVLQDRLSDLEALRDVFVRLL